MKNALFLFFVILLFSTIAKAQQSYNSLNVKDLNVNGNVQVVSTTESSKPCPNMTEAQRDALTPALGNCVYNTDTVTLNFYNGSAWKSAGGGVNKWLTGTNYQVDDVVINNDILYLCLIAHTSGTFATDLSGGDWVEVINQDLEVNTIKVGDVGLEAGGINVSGVNFSSTAKISDIDGTNYAQTILHRHSTLLEPLILGARSNSNDSSHADVVANQNLFTTYGSGYAGSNYKLFGSTSIAASSLGSISDTSSPGKLLFNTTPNGSVIPTPHLVLDSDKSSTFAGNISATNLSGTNTGDITIKAENGSSITPSEIQVPKSQLTETASNKHLIETGNKNILSNPSFEHSTFSTGWTCDVTPTAETTIKMHGTKALKLTLSAQAFECYQDSTIGAPYLKGNLTASGRVNTNFAGAYVCSRNDGVTSTTNCGLVNTDGTYSIPTAVPFIASSTSNGISITSKGIAVTGSLYADDMDVSPTVLNTQQNIGPWISFTPTGSWTTNTTYTGKYRQVGENMELDVYISTSGAPTSTDLTINLPSGFTIDTTKESFGSSVGAGYLSQTFINDSGTTFYAGAPATPNNSTSFYPRTINTASTYGSPLTINATRPITFGAGDFVHVTLTVPVTQFAGSSSIYTASCGANCVDKFPFRVSSTGVVSGDDLDLVNGNCSISDTSLFTCPWNASVFTVAPTCVTSFAADISSASQSSASTSLTTSQGVFRTLAGGSKSAQPFNVVCHKAGADFVATRTIVGSFAEVPTTKGSNGADIQSVYFGGNASCSSACTTGTCTICRQTGNRITSVAWQATGTYHLLGIDGTKYECTGTGVGGAYYPFYHDRVNSASTYARVISGTSTAANSAYNSIHCVGIP